MVCETSVEKKSELVLSYYFFFQEIDEMDPDDILRRQYEQLEMEKKEQVNKLRTQEKRIDYLVRAMRIEEIPLLEKYMAEKRVKDEEEWEKAEEERVSLIYKCYKVNWYKCYEIEVSW